MGVVQSMKITNGEDCRYGYVKWPLVIQSGEVETEATMVLLASQPGSLGER